MFIKFNEQNRCKQIIEFGNASIPTTVAATVIDKKKKKKKKQTVDDKSRGGQIMEQHLEWPPLTSALRADPYREQMLIASPPREVSSELKSRANLAETKTSCPSERRRRRRGPGRGRRMLISVISTALAVLLLGSASEATISSAPHPMKPSNQVPTYLVTAPHQITARAAPKFASPKLDHSYPSSLALVLAANQQHPDAPKLIPLSALDRYQEGADLKLFCSASAPQTSGRLQFEWRKNNGEQLFGTGSHSANGEETPNHKKQHLHISMMDDSSSMLRISHLEADDAGNYTCLARNQHGADSSTVRVNVNVRLKWIREPPSELEVRAGKSVQVECDASGQPMPLISWTSLKDHQTIASKVLRFDRIQRNDSGLYECRASASHRYGSAENSAGGEQLRKLLRLTVNGK